MAQRNAAEQQALEARTLRKVTLRILPFLMLLYLVSFLDRVNVGFAAITMNKDLGISAGMFSLGAAVFFIGYAGFEIPSNLALHRVGARRWIARIMFTWGVVSGATAFIRGPDGFLIARLLLGLAEAGFFPGIILYLSLWFPASKRARVGSWFMLAPPLASMFGAPLSIWMLKLGGFAGLRGWQWLFLVEALPAILLGIACLLVLTDTPERATWLTEEERTWLAATMAAERREVAGAGEKSILSTLRDARVLLLGLIYLGTSVGLYVVGIWGPLLLVGGGASRNATGWITAGTNAVAALGMLAWAFSSDMKGERLVHIALACAAAAAGLFLAGISVSLLTLVLGLALANIGANAAKPPLWTLPPVFLTGASAAAGIALVNSLGTLGGAVGPLLIGVAKTQFGAPGDGLVASAAVLLLSAGAVIPFARLQRRRATGPLNPLPHATFEETQA